MIYGAVAAFELGVIMMVVVVVLLASTHPVFADSYEKTQTKLMNAAIIGFQ